MSNRVRVGVSALVLLLGMALGTMGYLTEQPEAIIQWSTESEVETAGFHVYRAMGEEGAFERVTETLIPSSGDPFSGADYEFRDPNIEPGHVYYYQLEELETNGNFTRLPDTVRFETQPAPLFTLSYLNWWLIVILAGIILIVWLLPGPRTPASTGHFGKAEV